MEKNFDLSDRLNWKQACTVLGCGKSAFYELVKNSDLVAYGVGTRNRWYSRKECQKILDIQKGLQDAQK